MTGFPDSSFLLACSDALARVLERLGRARVVTHEEGTKRVETHLRANGKRRLVLTFEAGELVKLERFWRNGARRTLGAVKHGRADGEWFLVKRNGSLDRARTGLYRDGRWIGGIKGFNDWLGSA